uniref:DUF1120 domain-containing protein n=1 Tax=Pseudomonas laurentiana TaxID=2364649 RepID=UPI0029C89B56|nr:DUF1120 domain-containing protein [Pseudomonas laurentiana]
MNLFRHLLLSSACLLGATSAFASERADFRVKGVISPTPCTPLLDGMIDYGAIKATNLNPTEHTQLPEKTLNYRILCESRKMVAVSWTDARKGTASDTPNDYAFGLGRQGSNNIGKYFITNNATITADQTMVNMLYKLSGTPSEFQTGPDRYKFGTHTTHAFAPHGPDASPGAYATIASSIKVDTHIAPTNDLDLSNDIELDGLATMTLHYL